MKKILTNFFAILLSIVQYNTSTSDPVRQRVFTNNFKNSFLSRLWIKTYKSFSIAPQTSAIVFISVRIPHNNITITEDQSGTPSTVPVGISISNQPITIGIIQFCSLESLTEYSKQLNNSIEAFLGSHTLSQKSLSNFITQNSGSNTEIKYKKFHIKFPKVETKKVTEMLSLKSEEIEFLNVLKVRFNVNFDIKEGRKGQNNALGAIEVNFKQHKSFVNKTQSVDYSFTEDKYINPILGTFFPNDKSSHETISKDKVTEVFSDAEIAKETTNETTEEYVKEEITYTKHDGDTGKSKGIEWEKNKMAIIILGVIQLVVAISVISFLIKKRKNRKGSIDDETEANIKIDVE